MIIMNYKNYKNYATSERNLTITKSKLNNNNTQIVELNKKMK